MCADKDNSKNVEGKESGVDFRQILRDLYHSMWEGHGYEKIEHEAEDLEDALFVALYADAFGAPSPASYYTAELLPYMEEEFVAWQRRMSDRESVIERKGHQYHVH
ncbi:MAG: hypothetical protein ABEK59_05470 [Halobacteria archaeon]